jgi:hypothetical protein
MECDSLRLVILFNNHLIDSNETKRKMMTTATTKKKKKGKYIVSMMGVDFAFCHLLIIDLDQIAFLPFFLLLLFSLVNVHSIMKESTCRARTNAKRIEQENAMETHTYFSIALR